MVREARHRLARPVLARRWHARIGIRFPTRRAADDYAGTMESDQRKGTWIDSAAGRLSLSEWTVSWLDALDVSPNTEAQYRSLLTNHILDRWGNTSLAEVTGIGVAAWAKNLRAAAYAPATVRQFTDEQFEQVLHQ